MADGLESYGMPRLLTCMPGPVAVSRGQESEAAGSHESRRGTLPRSSAFERVQGLEGGDQSKAGADFGARQRRKTGVGIRPPISAPQPSSHGIPSDPATLLGGG